jgi:YgiT-type zinc finger domain-containing protein
MMKCAACHDKMVMKKGEIDLRIGGKLYLVKNVSYEECPACGEKVFASKISQELFEKVKLPPPEEVACFNCPKRYPVTCLFEQA